MEPRPGTYALVLSSQNDRRIRIGRLAHLHVRPGFYVYVGSAFGRGGVRARIEHHQRLSERPHWHIDYLRAFTQLEEVWYSHDPLLREHQWAQQMGGARGASLPIAGFGSSDCRCEAHLYFFRTHPSHAAFRRRLRKAFPGHRRVDVAEFGRPRLESQLRAGGKLAD